MELLKEANGANYDVVNAKCPEGKPVVVHRGPVIADEVKSAVKCNSCGKEPLEVHDFFYRCADCCNYVLCRHCTLISCDPPVLKGRETFHFHQCEMVRRPANDKDMREVYKKFNGRWCCDAVNNHLFPQAKGRCESQMKHSRFHSEHI